MLYFVCFIIGMIISAIILILYSCIYVGAKAEEGLRLNEEIERINSKTNE